MRLQQWYQEPFALTGHSLGGFSVLLYAGQNPEKISMLFPAAAVLSGNHLENAYKTHMPDYYDEYIKNGSSVVECSFKPGLTAIKPLSWLTDMREWDAAPLLKNLTMPVLLVVGEHDEPTPPEHQQEIYDGLATNNKTLHIIAGADHCYNPAPGQDKLTAILGDWLGKNKTSVTSQTNDQQKTAYKSRRRPSETAALYCSDRTANGREYRHDGTGNAELRCNGTAPCQPA